MSDFEARYQALCQAYAARLPGRLEELRELAGRARSEGHGGALDEARDAAHRLHGTAGSYGFDSLTAELRRIERALDALRAGGHDWSELEAALTSCSEAVARLSAGGTS